MSFGVGCSQPHLLFQWFARGSPTWADNHVEGTPVKMLSLAAPSVVGRDLAPC